MKSILNRSLGWLLSCVFGATGGYAYSHWQSAKTENVNILRASRFELTDDTGRVVAFWGAGQGGDTELAFLQRGSQDTQNRPTVRRPNEALSVGVTSTQVPFMSLQAKDGRPRALLTLGDYEKPVLIMSDEKYDGRLMLGFLANDAPSPRDDDWALTFRGPNVAGIGSLKDPVDQKYRGFLSVERTPRVK